MKIVNYLYATQLTICFASAVVSAIGGDQANQQHQQNGAAPPAAVQAQDVIIDGKVITNREQFADERLVWLSRKRGDSAAAFVTYWDILFAALYRAGVTNVREYLKVVWDASTINPQTGRRKFGTTKDVLRKMGMSGAEAETKSKAANKICRRLENNKRSNHFLVLLESLLFITGVVPFDEYSAKWVELSGEGPPERGLRAVQWGTIVKHFAEKMRTSTEKYWMQFYDRFAAFVKVGKANRGTQQTSAQPHVGQKRPAAAQPAVAAVAAPAAQRPRTATTSEQALNSVQALVNEHASLKQRVDVQEGIIRQLRIDVVREQAAVAQQNATIEQLTTTNQNLQTSFRASIAANQELSDRNTSLQAQLRQLQEENQRLKSANQGHVTVEQEPGIKQELGIKPEPTAGLDGPPN